MNTGDRDMGIESYGHIFSTCRFGIFRMFVQGLLVDVRRVQRGEIPSYHGCMRSGEGSMSG